MSLWQNARAGVSSAALDSLEETAVRLIALLVAALLFSTPASAQSWREYTYPTDAFAVAFPADPTIEMGTYSLADGSTVPARIYSLAQEEGVYKVTIADFSRTVLGEPEIMDHAVKAISQGEVKVDLPARIDRIYGRQLSIVGSDGSHTSVALFYYRNRLYQIAGTALPAAARAGASEAIRFQQSLRFTNDATRNFGFGTQFGASGKF